MKKLVFISTLILSLSLFNACTGDEKVKVGSLTPAKFELPFNNASAKKGEVIRVEVSVAVPEEVDEIRVFTKDTTIFEGNATKKNYVFEVSTRSWDIGTNQLTLESKTKEGKSRRDNRIIKIFPDFSPKDYTAEVIQVFPHATTSYTQGLEFDGGQLYEGTGGKGATGVSMVAKVDLVSGAIKEKKELDKKYFGEGITIMGDRLYQLTWQEHTCFVYDKNTLEELETFTYTGEGWGLCNDGENLIMSDGSERIYFRDPNTFGMKKSIEVFSNNGPVKGLNELEYINGKIYANIYTRNKMVIIDPETGAVTGNIDASILALDYRKTGEVLNGIAYKASTKQLFVTGKNWPNLLEIGLRLDN
ncbi:glutamine cyclotransferase [Brumimicrobium salinarum]|uniref:Glutamine cyclotransferase n=1 Tax=Brumimicrobium salinarum TaxID=2058658 RepID=A0A2I0R5Z8_9FLAO|nr:glutaminyl-peptide cyclotransferase [Brumimicrobium salinarum]PKR82003.1 glutamine cyclotransferase [Brumimicrobium salinarum]